MKLKELAEKIGATTIVDADIEIKGVAGLDSVKDGYLTLVISEKHLPTLKSSGASAVIVKEHIEDLRLPQIVAENPLLAFARAMEVFYVSVHPPEGVMTGAFVSQEAILGRDITLYPMSYISDGVSIGDRTVIYPGVFIGKGSSIGDECIIYPHVTIREGIKIGSRAKIQPGSVIGADGFGYVLDKGVHYKIPQVGGVIIEDNVEIGACVTIDRATTGNTIIGEGTKIDNLVQIAHNVTIGKNSIIVAQVGIAGSSQIGDYVTLAGQVGVSDHAMIDSHSVIGARSGVTGKLTKGIYLGVPARPYREFLRSQELVDRLPQLVKQLNSLEKELNALKRLVSGQDKETQ